MTEKPLKDVLDGLAAGAEQRWGFTYCECPVCEFSVVIASADLAGDKRVACQICELDNGRLVAMTMRPATDADRPEGVDARKRPMPHFTCAHCGRECLSPASEDKAVAEFKALYGVEPDPKKHPAICDDCFKLHQAKRR